jgi:signal transduction histidine kinase/FixJ family two-component response regulator
MATVLIVDDEERFRNESASYFERVGWKVFTAPDGDRAIALLEENRAQIDAMILDRNMPGKSGDDVIEWLYERQILDDICVIMLTAYSDYDNAVETLQAGAWQYLSKPLPLDALAALVAPGVAIKKCHRMRRTIFSAKNLEEVVQQIRKVIKGTLAPDACEVIFVPQIDLGEHCGGGSANYDRPFIKALQTGRAYISESDPEKVRVLRPVLEDASSLMAVPVFNNDGATIGVLDIESRKEKAFSSRWIEVLRYCGDLIGTFETVRDARKVKDIALINRELRHRLATSVTILAQETNEARRIFGEQPPDSPLSVISRHVEVVGSVMDDLREITREHPPVQITDVSPYNLLMQIDRGGRKVPVLGPQADSKDLLARADPEGLSYCLDCIFQNAYEAIDVRRLQDPSANDIDHHIILSVEDDQEWIRVRIEDTGVGLTQEVHERLFEPLFSTKTRRGNDGIGLYSAKRMIEAMGGQVGADSAGEFQGTCFTILLVKV